MNEPAVEGTCTICGRFPDECRCSNSGIPPQQKFVIAAAAVIYVVMVGYLIWKLWNGTF